MLLLVLMIKCRKKVGEGPCAPYKPSLQVIAVTKNWQLFFYPLCNVIWGSCAAVWYTSRMAQLNHWWPYSVSFSFALFMGEDRIRWKGWERDFLRLKSYFTACDSTRYTTIGAPECRSLSLNHKAFPRAICKAFPSPHLSGIAVPDHPVKPGHARRTEHTCPWERGELTALLPIVLQGFRNI